MHSIELQSGVAMHASGHILGHEAVNWNGYRIAQSSDYASSRGKNMTFVRQKTKSTEKKLLEIELELEHMLGFRAK